MFEELSGQTHQMDPVKAFLLHLLNDGAQELDALVTEFASVPEFADSVRISALLTKAMDELCTHGLVEATYR
ncbi:MAG: hypothetical protein IT423_23140 [Pirellulaceae bacterium]|nr:hypothetical protein [Pirellulaceae bacterium]